MGDFLLNFYDMKKIFTIFVLLLVILAIFAFFQGKKRINAVSDNQETVLLEIPKGSSAAKVSQILQEKGVWKDGLAFKVRNKMDKPSLKAGWYEIPPQQTLEQIFALLESGKNAVRRVTIPEAGKSPPT